MDMSDHPMSNLYFIRVVIHFSYVHVHRAFGLINVHLFDILPVGIFFCLESVTLFSTITANAFRVALDCRSTSGNFAHTELNIK